MIRSVAIESEACAAELAALDFHTTAKEQAIDVIQELPPDVDFTRMIGELAFLAGTEAARDEMRRDEGMDSMETKQKLREWLSR